MYPLETTDRNYGYPARLLVGLVLLGFVGGSAVWAGEPLLRIEMD